MIHDGLQFHNVEELIRVDGAAGLRLQRVPEALRRQLDEGTAGVMLSPANSEIRFRIREGERSASLRLSANRPTTAYVYHGTFQGELLQLDVEPKDFVIRPHRRLGLLTPEDCARFAYHPALVRICFGGEYPEPVFYHGHSAEIVPALENDFPPAVYLAYGSSIAHGTNLAGAALSYPAHVAMRLGYDLRNLGASGCCLCEAALANYLAEQPCDLMTLELSVNLLGRGFTADAFKSRAAYLVRRVADANPLRQVVAITIFPHYHDIDPQFRNGEQATAQEYRQVLRDIVKDLGRPNLHLVEGPDLLPDIDLLSQDLLHPGARGMIRIGEELVRKIRSILAADSKWSSPTRRQSTYGRPSSSAAEPGVPIR